MALIQILLIAFLFFALTRVLLQFRNRNIKWTEFLFWSLLFITAITGIALPEEVSKLANFLGISRGVDLIVYASIAGLFYLVFRAYVLMEDIRHEVTELIRRLALEGKNKTKDK